MSRRYCLILDDDRIAATFLIELVAAQGLIVDSACSTTEADQRLAQRRYDVLLVDRRLPDGDGVHWLKRLLERAGADPKPRCMVTSGDLINAALLPAGVDQLRKPVDAEQLCNWLSNIPNPAAAAHGAEPPAAGERWERTDLLDDAGALARFGGNRDALQSLRAMLLVELTVSAGWRTQLRRPTPPAAAIDALHRLRAACALTGCLRLGLVSAAIESDLRSGSPLAAGALDDLDVVLAATTVEISR